MPATIYLQSFFSEPKGFPVSVARWQPKGYKYPEIQELIPMLDGRPIRKMPPDDYLREYVKVLRGNSKRILMLGKRISLWEEGITFCCWCNEERQKGYPKLFCHTILIGYLFERIVPGIKVEYMDGRDRPVWGREEFYQVMRGG